MNRSPRRNEDVTDRRSREDEAPRLRAVVPRLLGLRLDLTESRRGGDGESSHIKRVVVEHAPALFLIPCGDSRCKAGGYDLTPLMMAKLYRSEESFDVNDTCGGQTGSAECGRVLKCTATATYSPP